MLKKLIKKLLALLIIILIIGTTIFMLFPPKPDNYMYAINDKHTRLSTIESPKLIIIGGSNAAFGVNSVLLEEKLDMPVVNMAIHIGLRLEYMLNEIKPDINEGDIILLLPEYSHLFYKVEAGFTKAFYRANEVYPQAIKFISPENIPGSLIHTYVDLLQTKLKTLLIPTGVESNKHVIRNQLVYRRQSFNKYGDMVAHLNMEAQTYEKDRNSFISFKGRKVSGDYISLTNSFHQYITDKKATLLMSFSPIPEGNFNESIGNEIEQNLKTKATYQVLGSPIDFVYNDTLFFDTRHHLVSASRKSRTEALIRFIRESINKNR